MCPRLCSAASWVLRPQSIVTVSNLSRACDSVGMVKALISLSVSMIISIGPAIFLPHSTIFSIIQFNALPTISLIKSNLVMKATVRRPRMIITAPIPVAPASVIHAAVTIPIPATRAGIIEIINRIGPPIRPMAVPNASATAPA